jgi:MFS family permease
MARNEFTRPAVTAAIAASVGMFVGTTPMVSAVASLFIVPISEEFNISRTDFSVLMLVSPWIVALFAPFGGKLLDRYGTRRVILPVVLVFGLTQWGLWASHSLWQVIVLFGFTGVCGAVHTYTSYTRVVSMWFARRRGIVMGFMIALGSALGGVIVPQLVRIWIRDYDWHDAYLGMGCIILFYGLPMLFLFLREPASARPATLASAAKRVQLAGNTWSEALRSRTFWTVEIALVLAPLGIIGTVAHMFPMLTERGFDPTSAGYALSSVYIGGMFGQICSGYLLDRVNSPRIVLPFFAVGMVGITIVHTTHTLATLIPGAMLLGIGSGSEIGIAAYLMSRFFGLKSYGAIYSTVFAGANVGLGLGILAMGQAHDRFGSYAPMAYLMPVALLLTIGLLATLKPYTYEKQSAVPEDEIGDTPIPLTPEEARLPAR